MAKRHISQLLVLVGAMLTSLLFGNPAAADEHITIVVPFPPGGSNDIIAREIGHRLGKALNQTVVIDNRPGASGNTGAAFVAHATPDGRTLLMTSSSLTTNAAIDPRLPFDPVRSFSPVAMVAKGPMLIAVSTDFPAASLSEMVSVIRAHPGRYNYASSGIGSANQLAVESLKAQLGNLHITHIPYRGIAPAIADLVGNQTQVIFANGPSLIPMIKAGRLRAIGITSLAPSSIAPELSPLSSIAPGYEFVTWWGFLAPAGTPSAMVSKLNSAINTIVSEPATKASFLQQGAEPVTDTPQAFSGVIADEMTRWRQLVKQQKIAPDALDR